MSSYYEYMMHNKDDEPEPEPIIKGECPNCGKTLYNKSYGIEGSSEGRELCKCGKGCYKYDHDRECVGSRYHDYEKCCLCGQQGGL